MCQQHLCSCNKQICCVTTGNVSDCNLYSYDFTNNVLIIALLTPHS